MSAYSDLRPQEMSKVRIHSEFWKNKITVNHKSTIAACIRNCENTERINNFKRAAGTMEGGFQGYYFDDSDVYKVLEGIAYTLAVEPDPELEKKADQWIDLICSAQQEDGYLVCYFILGTNGETRWTDMERHEDYCLGHMIEAAIAYKHAVGKDRFYRTAVRFADHFCDQVGEGKKNWVPGHQEIELALVKLYHESGDAKYLRQAQWLLEQRGKGHGRGTNIWENWGADYAQDHMPVSEMRDITGHAVRAMYMYAGMCGVVKETGNAQYLRSLDNLWKSVVQRNMYLTGGIGSTRENEGFTEDYDLPNDTAYCESCASIGMIIWNQRMNDLYGEAKYADVVERELYNGAISGVSLDGTKFFYVNPLESDGNHHRVEWYGCSCCPTQISRFIPSIGQYIYSVGSDGIYINQYIASETEVTVGETKVRVLQETRYPWDNVCDIRISTKEGGSFLLNLRIPEWCGRYRVFINGEAYEEPFAENGYMKLLRDWEGETGIRLVFDMPVRFVRAHPFVVQDRGRLAVMRGPVVYCAEQADNETGLDEIAISPDMEAALVKSGLGIDNIVLRDGDRQYTFLPYFAWDNRQPGKMKVWIRQKHG